MTQPNDTPDRDGFSSLMTPKRAVPIVETPSRWPALLMTMLYLAACALAAFLVLSA